MYTLCLLSVPVDTGASACDHHDRLRWRQLSSFRQRVSPALGARTAGLAAVYGSGLVRRPSGAQPRTSSSSGIEEHPLDLSPETLQLFASPSAWPVGDDAIEMHPSRVASRASLHVAIITSSETRSVGSISDWLEPARGPSRTAAAARHPARLGPQAFRPGRLVPCRTRGPGADQHCERAAGRRGRSVLEPALGLPPAEATRPFFMNPQLPKACAAASAQRSRPHRDISNDVPKDFLVPNVASHPEQAITGGNRSGTGDPSPRPRYSRSALPSDAQGRPASSVLRHIDLINYRVSRR